MECEIENKAGQIPAFSFLIGIAGGKDNPKRFFEKPL
jgi:hypothetical protein